MMGDLHFHEIATHERPCVVLGDGEELLHQVGCHRFAKVSCDRNFDLFLVIEQGMNRFEGHGERLTDVFGCIWEIVYARGA